MRYRVKLDIFEGPFDLLVYLIEHAQMSIYDIEISEITDQYMAFLNDMERADIGLSSEFMVLASLLLEIKSRMLLPGTGPGEEETVTQEDPRTELAEKLAEYKKFKFISEMLENEFDSNSMCLEKPQEDLTVYTGTEDEYLQLDEEKSRRAFISFLSRKRKVDEVRKHHKMRMRNSVSTESRIKKIRKFFMRNRSAKANFKELLDGSDGRYEIAVTFASLMELLDKRQLSAEQKYTYGDIMVKAKKEMFEINHDRGS